MKFMTFNRSCAYAGVANLLEKFAIDKQDRDIAIEMKLPYFFYYDQNEKEYQAGPQLQNKVWFDLYLRPLGLEFIEKKLTKAALPAFLRNAVHNLMLGINIGNGRHTVVFQRYVEPKYIFLNMMHAYGNENPEISFTEAGLKAAVDEQVQFGYLQKEEKIIPLLDDIFCASIEYWKQYLHEVTEYMLIEQSSNSLAEHQEKFFAPLFLDTFSMMELLQEAELVKKIAELRTSYLQAMKTQGAKQLSKWVDLNAFTAVIENIIDLIRGEYSRQPMPIKIIPRKI
ncbi:MAG: hypothetical protein PHC32_05765 [Candidatus Izemoplasmatales bacterium]|nr:hypothetical protein [Candidatus Izemoplasmatales bacterium]MDD3865811.1 hypothetical protein [Candidatus Izemoplasmatales bacterium]